MNGDTTNSNSTDANKKVQSGVVAITPEFGDPVEEPVNLATTDNVFYGFYGYGRYEESPEKRADIRKLAPIILKLEASALPQPTLEAQWEIAKKRGFSNDRHDYGKETMCGITIKTYRDYKERKGLPEPTIDDLKNISLNEWLEILRYYWDEVKADQIQNQSIANLCVDSVWLCNRSKIIKRIQIALNVTDDGTVGPNTLAAINNANQHELFERLVEIRKNYHEEKIKNDKSQEPNRKGWMNRLAEFKFEEGRPLKSHKGYDYEIAKRKVIAVASGKIVQVRIGPRSITCYTKNEKNKDKEGKIIYEYLKDEKPFKCKLLEKIKDNDFSEEVCVNCLGKSKYQNNPWHTIRSACYGVQLWIKLDGNPVRYAFYAHLSKLPQNIIEPTLKYLKDTTAKFEDKDFEGENDNRIVKKGDPVGMSGRTGLAFDVSPEHLHFECREGNLETGSQISPNNIVHTKFYIKKGNESVFDDEDETKKWSEISSTLHEKWKSIRDNIRKYKIVPKAESVVPIQDFQFMEKEQFTLAKKATRTMDVSIDPYQIIRKSGEKEEPFQIKEETIIENNNETCDNLADRMPWRNDLSESCQCLPNNQKKQMSWQSK